MAAAMAIDSISSTVVSVRVCHVGERQVSPESLNHESSRLPVFIVALLRDRVTTNSVGCTSYQSAYDPHS
jgi:hypothetical protein